MVNVRFGWFGFMVFNVTFNNISVTSWWSALLVEKTSNLPQVKLDHIILFRKHMNR
jgi:hypothetical protein